jgi:hypothetical protein
MDADDTKHRPMKRSKQEPKRLDICSVCYQDSPEFYTVSEKKDWCFASEIEILLCVDCEVKRLTDRCKLECKRVAQDNPELVHRPLERKYHLDSLKNQALVFFLEPPSFKCYGCHDHLLDLPDAKVTCEANLHVICRECFEDLAQSSRLVVSENPIRVKCHDLFCHSYMSL